MDRCAEVGSMEQFCKVFNRIHDGRARDIGGGGQTATVAEKSVYT